MFELVDTIIGLVGGGAIVTLVTMPSIVKKSKAEARAAELDNALKVIEGWEKLANERQEDNSLLEEKIRNNELRIDELNKRIDELYVINGDWRDKYNTIMEENTALKVKIATDEVKMCMVRGCAKREPQSGY